MLNISLCLLMSVLMDGSAMQLSSKCKLDEGLKSRALGVPEPRQLPGTETKVSHMIIADEAFPLRDDIMKPFPMRNLTREQRIFNYCLSRARKVVENAFGILANRFGVFQKPISLNPANVEMLVLSCLSLHNFLLSEDPPTYTILDSSTG